MAIVTVVIILILCLFNCYTVMRSLLANGVIVAEVLNASFCKSAMHGYLGKRCFPVPMCFSSQLICVA